MSLRDTSVADRTAAIESAFEEAPRAQLPAEVQQIMIDERPRGAVSVHVKRDELEVLRKIKVIATAAGDDFFYSWPTKNRDGTKGVVEGPSIKCANAVSRIFGNCSVKVRVFDQGAHWVFYAQFYDLETGYVLERPFQQRKNQKTGMGDADRQTDIVFQIGTSKAARNVVCNALSEFTDYAFAVAKEQLVEKIGRNLPRFIEQIRARLVDLKVELVRVELVRGKPIAQWLAGDAAKTIAEIRGVNDGMAHPDELWPVQGTEAGSAKPQPEDFKPKPGADGGAGGKGADPAPAQAQPGAKPQTPATPAAEAPKPEGQPAAAAGAQAQVSETVAEKSPAPAEGQAEEGQRHHNGGGPHPDQGREPDDRDDRVAAADHAEAGEDRAAVALEAAEAMLQRGIDNLAALRTAEQVDEQAPTILEVLRELEDLDPEDLALLSNRWKTAQLERKRDIAKRAKPRR